MDRRIDLDFDNWKFLRFLTARGADEFGVRILYWGNTGDPGPLEAALAPFSLGTRERECTVWSSRQEKVRPTPVWQLNAESIAVLATLMPRGILTYDHNAGAWLEDLCVYRGGELVFGTVTHEQFAFVRLSDDEWASWQAAE